MTDLKERFSAAALDEPPFFTRVSDAVRRGRFEQRRRLAVGWVGGVAVVAVAVSAAVSLPSFGSRDSLPVPGGGPATSTTTTEPAPTLTSEPTATSTGPKYDDAAVNAIFAARQARASLIVAAVRAHLEQAGYTVQTVSADLSVERLMEPSTAAGYFQIKAGVSKGTEFWQLDVGADNVGDYKSPGCTATEKACTLQKLPGGGILLTADGVASVLASNGDLREATVAGLSFDAANAASMSRSVLVSIVKDPAFDLSAVPRLNVAQIAVVQADLDARHESTSTQPAAGTATAKG